MYVCMYWFMNSIMYLLTLNRTHSYLFFTHTRVCRKWSSILKMNIPFSMKQLTRYMLHRLLQKEDTRINVFLGHLARKCNEPIGLNLAAKHRESVQRVRSVLHFVGKWTISKCKSVNFYGVVIKFRDREHIKMRTVNWVKYTISGH